MQLPAHARSDSNGESRMREICTSGSTRGDEVVLTDRSLLYSTGRKFFFRIASPVTLYASPPIPTFP